MTSVHNFKCKKCGELFETKVNAHKHELHEHFLQDFEVLYKKGFELLKP